MSISELIGVANEQVFAKTGKTLTDVQECILQQVLEGKKAKDIHITGYANSTIKRGFCPNLWQLLTDAIGEKVGVNNVQRLLERVQQERKGGDPPPLPPPKQVLHNLPAPSCTTFIGRQEEVTRLLELLSPGHAAHLISVDGIGGVGKTTLVVEAAYRCLQASNNSKVGLGEPTFDVIIFTSAKKEYLTPFGLLPSLVPRKTLSDIFRQIARNLDDLDISGASFAEQVDLIKESLFCQRTLLIVDNLETVENQQDVLAFLYELPATVKAVITTREQIVFVPVRLTSLPKKDGLHLIQHEAQEKGVTLTHQDSLALYRETGGIPVAISYAIGQLANGYLIKEVLERISQSTGDVARFCFESSVKLLQGQPAHKLLMALALFPMPAPGNALVQVAVPEADPNIKDDLARLRGLSLVKYEENRYSMLPLTREYALAELEAYPDFELEARERWISWYLDFSAEHGGQDAQEWQGQCDGLEQEWQNLQAVIDWCIAQGRYADFLKIWRNIEAYTQIMGSQKSRWGYWDDRLNWTTFLMQAAKQRGDWQVLTEVMVDRAWTLTSMGKPNQLKAADELFEGAWELRHHQDQLFQVKLAKNIAVLHIQQQRFNEAQTWLNRTLELLEPAQLPEPTQLRLLTQVQYYQGESLFKTGEYEQAKIRFQKALELAQVNDWRRAIFCTQNWLADIAVKQGDLEYAQQILTEGLQVAKVNQDKCRMAFCQRSWSSLAKAQGNLAEARRWAREARDNFENLGMMLEAEETQTFLLNLEVALSEVSQPRREQSGKNSCSLLPNP